jgi:hypothetical protein
LRADLLMKQLPLILDPLQPAEACVRRKLRAAGQHL